MITTPGFPSSAASASEAENSVPSADCRVSDSAGAPPAIGANSAGSSGGRESKSKHMTRVFPLASGLSGLDGRGARVYRELVRHRLARGFRLEDDEVAGALQDLAEQPVDRAIGDL